MSITNRWTGLLGGLGLVLVSGLGDTASAQEEPVARPASRADEPVPAPAGESPERPADEGEAAPRKSDPKALEILRKAARRQGGEELEIESFHAWFGKVAMERERAREDGSVERMRVEADPGGMRVDWKAGSLRTDWSIDGTRTVRAWNEAAQMGWIQPGGKGAGHPLLGEQYAKDLEQLRQHRDIVRLLLDLALLRNLAEDGSVWRVVPPEEQPHFRYEGIALERTPPRVGPEEIAAKGVVPIGFLLWLDPETFDPVAAIVPPTQPGDSILHYSFRYHDGFPAVTGADLRFPFWITVFEQRVPEQEPTEILDVQTRELVLNRVPGAAFRMPN